MPNWVFNRIEGYTPEMMEKYKDTYTDNGKEITVPISFQKIIPMPKELNDIPSGTLAENAKMIHEFEEYKKNKPEEEWNRYDRLKLNDDINRRIDGLYTNVGRMALLEPDRTISDILNDEKNKYIKKSVDMFRDVTGDIGCRTPERIPSTPIIGEDGQIRRITREERKAENDTITRNRMIMLDKYAKVLNDDYVTEKAKVEEDKRFKPYQYPFDSLSEMGAKIAECVEKYGAEDWYKWRNIHWNTKWDVCEPEYDEEEQTLRFDTAWAVPEPILGKIQEDFPDAKLTVYSEEETGWFNEYETKEDGKIHQTIEGELNYQEDEETGEVTTNEVSNPVDRIITSDPNQATVAIFNEIDQKFR